MEDADEPVAQIIVPASSAGSEFSGEAVEDVEKLDPRVQALVERLGLADFLGVPGPSGLEPQFGGTIYVFGREPATFDPHRYQSYRIRMTNSYFHQRLLRFEQGAGHSPVSFVVEPSVAESWEIQDGGKKYVFNLREGVQWHDVDPVNGRELVASDVVFTYDRIGREDMANTQKQWLLHVTSVTAPDDYTVVMEASQPVAAMLQFVAKTNMEILAPEAEEKCGDFALPECAAAGLGPWIFQSYDPNVGTVNTRNPTFWDAPYPYIDKVVQLFFGDERSEDAAFRTGKVDILGIDTCGISGERYKGLKKTNPELIYPSFIDSLNRRGLHLKMDRPPFNDVAVRRAASMAVNREGWVATCLDGFGIPFGGFLAHGNAYWIPDDEYGDGEKYLKFDPDGARQMLADAGYGPDDIHITLEGTTGYGPRFDCEVELFAEFLNDVGINTEISMVDYDSFVPVWNQGKFENAAFTYFGFGTMPEDWIVMPFHSAQRGIKHYGLNNPELDELLDGISTSFDSATRVSLTQEAAKIVVDQAYMINGAWWIYIYTQNPRVQDYGYLDVFDNALGIQYAWLND